MSVGPCGDMYVVIGHDSKLQVDKKQQTVSLRSHYFAPIACNTLKEAQDFVKKVKHAYSADVVRMWNPVDRDELLRIADEIEESDVDGCIDWHDRIRKACGLDETEDRNGAE